MARRRTAPSAAAVVVFNPQSLDATLAAIITKLDAFKLSVEARFDAQDCELRAIKEQALKTNGRVSLLELWRETSKAKLAAWGASAGAFGSLVVWLAGILLK